MKIFSKSDEAYDFADSVNQVTKEFEPYFSDWVEELANQNTDLKGKALYEWYPGACGQFLTHLDSYVYNRFGNAPDNFLSYMQSLLNDMMSRSLSKWKKAAVVKSFDEEMPEGLKRRLDDLE
ncbi:MAG: hypothetical protein AB1483_06060 [Candidatus Zixiibacteriota bacterium]